MGRLTSTTKARLAPRPPVVERASATDSAHRMAMRRVGCVGLGALTFLATSGLQAIPARPPGEGQRPPWREEVVRPGTGLPITPLQQRIFGIGVGFEKSGTLAGVPLNIVLPGSPAARAGLVAGCVIAEINGESTIGRPGDDCARLIREALGTVRLKFLDPAMKEKTLVLEKEWIVVPE